MDDRTAPERWLPIPGYEGWYEVSDHGRVRSVDRTILRRDGVSQRCRGHLFATRLNEQGRPVVVLRQADSGSTWRVHALVLLAFVGPRPAGMEACHEDGDRANNRLANLRWDTRSGNRHDSVRHGTHLMTRRLTCPRNHLLSPPNLVVHSAAKRHRECLACRRATVNGQHATQTGAPFDFREAADKHYTSIMDGTDRGRPSGRTDCPRGHLLSEPNLVRSALADGRRSCLACARAAGRMHSARRYGKVIDFVAVANSNYERIMSGADLR